MVMRMENYLLINQQTNVVDNLVVWDGNTEEWTPPPSHLALPQAATMALVWTWDAAISEYVLTQKLGQGEIGFSWNGTECVTNEPKPTISLDQPETSGTQTL